jgi:hypothetical protein
MGSLTSNEVVKIAQHLRKERGNGRIGIKMYNNCFYHLEFTGSLVFNLSEWMQWITGFQIFSEIRGFLSLSIINILVHLPSKRKKGSFWKSRKNV